MPWRKSASGQEEPLFEIRQFMRAIEAVAQESIRICGVAGICANLRNAMSK
jgi:hypothetical protein